MCVCTDQAGRGAQQPWAVLGSAGGRRSLCPETFTGSAATTVVLPLAAPLARNVLELHLAVGHWLGLGFGLGLGFVCSRCSMRCHAAGTKGRHTACFPPSPQATPHGSRLASAWMRACSPSPQTVSHRRMPLRVEVPRLGRTAEILASLSWEVITGQTGNHKSTYFWGWAIVRWKCDPPLDFAVRSFCRA